MLALARVADRGPMSAAVLAAGLFMAVLLIPRVVVSSGFAGLFIFGSFVAMACLIASAAVVAFVALRHGEQSALQVTAGCLLLLVVMSLVLYGTAVYIPLVALICWLPAIVAAIVLARSVKLDYAVLAVVACGALSVIALNFAMGGDPTVFWERQYGDSWSGAAVADGSSAASLYTEEQLEEFTTTMAKLTAWLTGVYIISMAFGALFIARAWQADLVNPGGFQKEFHGLSLGRNAAFLCMLIVVLSMFIGGHTSVAIALVVLFAFFLQGLAVVHALVKQRGMHRFWLHGIYVLMVLLHTFLLLAALGLADNMLNLRGTNKEQ